MPPPEAMWYRPGVRDTGEEHTQFRWARCYYNEQVYGGETVKKEKCKDLCTLKRLRTEDVRVVRKSLM